jgi:hypothetical protein
MSTSEAAEMSQLKDTVEILKRFAPLDLRNSYWNRTPLKVQYVVISFCRQLRIGN